MRGGFLKNRLIAFKYAAKGAWILVRKESSIQAQLFVALCVVIAGFYFEISPTEWVMQLFAIALVLSVEGLNTAVEELANFIHPDFHHKIGLIKDIAAGAVFFAALFAVVIAAIIYIPYFI